MEEEEIEIIFKEIKEMKREIKRQKEITELTQELVHKLSLSLTRCLVRLEKLEEE